MAAQTLCDLFFEATQRSRPNAFRVPRAGAYHDVSMKQFARDVERASLGLTARGIRPGSRVAILSESRYEWAVADFAILTAAAITVPIFPTLPFRQIEDLLQHSGARALFVSTEEQLRKLERTGPAASGLETIVTFDSKIEASGRTMPLEALFALGAEHGSSEEHRRRAALPKADDVATIIYTSGTTGIPKGVMLTHDNLLSNVDGSRQRLGLGPEDVHLSVLPLSHVLERMGGLYTMLRAGAGIAYAEAPERIGRNLLQVRPTVLIGVPRIYGSFYTRLRQAIRESPPARRRLLEWAERTAREWAHARLSGHGVPLHLRARHALAEALVYPGIRARFGGRIRIFISGAAPLPAEVAEFFIGVGLPIYEGYGLTETSPVLSLNYENKVRAGTTGPPVPGVEISIAEDGEILARGSNVMKGYYLDEEATHAAFQNGWFRTGDIGHLDADGFLVITDRKKDILVTAGGKNVAPQPIENRLRACPYISEAILFGDRRRYVAALLVPDFAALEKWASARQIESADHAAMTGDPRVRAHFQAEIEKVNGDLAPFEKIRRFEITPEPLTIEAGDLTPTLKVKRAAVARRFERLIAKLYADEAQ